MLESQIKHNKHNNLSKEQWKGLIELRDNPEIVINKADKGSAIVIMKTTDYLKEGYRQIGDKNFYTKLKNEKMKTLKLITEKNFEYLNISNPKAG